MMVGHIKNYMKTRPHLYDAAKRVRHVLGKKSPDYRFFNDFSKARGGRVSFVQVGASDGLRCDPIREFVVRDRWSGIFVEPVPGVFEELKKNYRYLRNPELCFVNAAVSSSTSEGVVFWTFDEDYLRTLGREERLDLLRKSSFDPDHLKKCFGDRSDYERIVKQIRVPSVTLSELVERHRPGGDIDLVVIDAEGHEPDVIRSIDFGAMRPQAIYFESDNLGGGRDALYRYLREQSYELRPLGANTAAIRRTGGPADSRMAGGGGL